MAPDQNWRADAVVRLLASVIICIYIGSVAGALVRHLRASGPEPVFLAVATGGTLALAAALVLIRRPIRRENLLRQLGISLGCFYAGMLLAAWTIKLAGPGGPSVLTMFVSGLSFQGAAIILVMLFLREHRLGWNAGFGFNHRGVQAVLLGTAIGLAFLPLGWMLQLITAEILQHFPALKPEEQEAVRSLKTATSSLHRIGLAITTILLAPLAEELLFRGVLYQWIRRAGFPALALWGLSAVFAGIHQNLLIFLPLFFLSVVLSVLYERTGNLLAPITAHAVFNATNFVMLYIVQRSTAYSP